MSNHQWNSDQAEGERAMREHEKNTASCICDRLTRDWSWQDRAALCDHLPACPQNFMRLRESKGGR